MLSFFSKEQIEHISRCHASWNSSKEPQGPQIQKNVNDVDNIKPRQWATYFRQDATLKTIDTKHSLILMIPLDSYFIMKDTRQYYEGYVERVDWYQMVDEASILKLEPSMRASYSVPEFAEFPTTMTSVEDKSFIAAMDEGG